MATQQKLYAFWRYDKFPYLLGGPVREMRPSGCVETENFGPGFYFAPVKILPLKEGRELAVKLEALEVAKRAADKKFNAEWDKKLEELAPFALEKK